VQVDPMKPNLKPPGTKRMKLYCDILLSTSAFTFSLRRCAEAPTLFLEFIGNTREAGAYKRSLLSST
jgi:hypothetical protein